MNVHHHHLVTEHHPEYAGLWPLGFDVRLSTADCYICGPGDPYLRKLRPSCPLPLDVCVEKAQADQERLRTEARTSSELSG